MYIRVIGAGALGMLIAAYLSRAGARVEIVTRTAEQARLLREQGLLVTVDTQRTSGESPHGEPVEFTAAPTALTFDDAAAGGNVAAMHRAGPDAILLMVKQTAVTDRLAQGIRVQLQPGSTLVCFQNGIGHMELLSRHLPPEQLITGVTTEGAYKHSPRHVSHTGNGTTWLGSEFANRGSSAEFDDSSVKNLQNQLMNAGFSVSLSNSITSKVWNKLLMNAVINPVSSVLQIRNGLLPELPDALLLMRCLFEEGVTLADKLGIQLATDLWEQLLDVCKRTANNRSSMLQDVLSRRLTETDAITGGLLSRGEQAGVLLPTHRAMYHLLRAIEQQWDVNIK